MHEHLDAGKRSVVVDLAGDDGDSALEWADLVIISIDGYPNEQRFELPRAAASRLTRRR